MDHSAAIVVGIGAWDIAPWREAFARRASGRDVIFWPQDGRDAVPASYYVCSWKAAPALYERFAYPKAFVSLGAGVDHIPMQSLVHGVPVLRIVDSSLTARMVEYVSLAVLYLHREVGLLASWQRQQTWTAMIQPMSKNVTVGIMGQGVLGQACATALAGLDYQVIGWSRTHRSTPHLAFAGQDELLDFLNRTDILVNLLPNTPQTRGLIGMDVMGRLGAPGLGKRYFVNVGRGETVVEADLVQALKDEILAGAVLDVFATEPLPAGHPLWSMDNVLVTPHVAASSDPAAVAALVFEVIAQMERGGAPPHTVDPARGY